MMEDKEIINILEKAINQLFDKDYHLLKHGLSEQCISHKFAEKLQVLFPNFDVDCEYNGDIENESEKKAIHFLKQDLLQIGKLSDKENEIEEDLLTRAVFPDIIIHRRGTNEFNLCIIEVKKPGNKVADKYDYFKLQIYTGGNHGNHLSYQLGAFILFIPGDEPKFQLTTFKDGQQVEI